MFIWVRLPEHIDSMKLLDEAIAELVAFVPGAPFYANDAAKEYAAPELRDGAAGKDPRRRGQAGQADQGETVGICQDRPAQLRRCAQVMKNGAEALTASAPFFLNCDCPATLPQQVRPA